MPKDPMEALLDFGLLTLVVIFLIWDVMKTLHGMHRDRKALDELRNIGKNIRKTGHEKLRYIELDQKGETDEGTKKDKEE